MIKRIQAHVTRMKLISNVTQFHKEFLKIPKDHLCLGIIACDVENVMYLALDEASKKANIKVVYSSAAFTGHSNAWADIRGQVVGMISAKNLEDVRKGLEYTRSFIEKEAELYTFDEDRSLLCYAHLIPRAGKYYQERYGIPQGMAAGHVACSPLENTYALDKALKAGNTKIAELFEMPVKSNIGGAVLYGSYAACKSSIDSYIQEVEYCFLHPLD